MRSLRFHVAYDAAVLTRQEVIERFETIRQAPLTRGRRAPHKPLLLLYLLGRIQRDETARVAYREAEPTVSLLINEFGPPAGDRHRAAMPFFHLYRSLWMLDEGSNRPVHSELRSRNAHGTLRHEVETALRTDPVLLAEVARKLLEANFPESYFGPICQAVGLELLPAMFVPPAQRPQTRRRASDFREAVLLAYNYACAMCGFDGRLGRDPVGLQAAHVHWHALGGPDDVANGLALCDLHHTLFDRGALGLKRAKTGSLYHRKPDICSDQRCSTALVRAAARPPPARPQVERSPRQAAAYRVAPLAGVSRNCWSSATYALRQRELTL